MMRVLVTGGSGFIGRHCLRRLSSEDCEVHAISRTPMIHPSSRIVWHAANILDQTSMSSVMCSVKPTHLLHCAWTTNPGDYQDSLANLEWLRASLNLAEAFGRAGGKRFVGVGSSAEYAPGEQSCVEDRTSLDSSWTYGKCKVDCWRGIEQAASRHDFSAAWARLFLLYGPGDHPRRLIPQVMESLRSGQALAVTEGTQIRDFIFAPDVADALVRLLLVSSKPGAFNIGTGVGTSVRSVIDRLADRLAGRDLIKYGARGPVRGEPGILVADMSKTSRELSWVAPTTIADGLEALLAGQGGV